MSSTSVLKVAVKGYASMAKEARVKEVKKVTFLKLLKHKQSFRHKKDEPKPAERNEWPTFKGDTHALESQAFFDFWGLHRFRTVDLRRQARVALMAYGFTRGVPYSVMEFNAYSLPNFEEVKGVAREASNEGDNAFNDKWEKWETEAKEYYAKHGNLNPSAIEEASKKVAA